MNSQDIIKDVKKLANPKQAVFSQRFFKTQKGEYAEGDVFLGLTVPQGRLIAKKYYRDTPLSELVSLIKSPIHEHRFIALEILVFKFENGSLNEKERAVQFYLRYTKYVNNWDLVDTSAPYILGVWLIEKDRNILYKFARSQSLWERRIAIVSTLAFIRNSQFKDTLNIIDILLNDTHDLIHKATGWMLREVGKKSESKLVSFLNIRYKRMPRTMLRYAIERLSESQRKKYLSKK